MFGLRSPVPRTIRIKPMKNAERANTIESAIERCPNAMRIPPYQMARRSPRSLSAIHPPGSDVRYTQAE
jgi:hypothetical protein